ncbi:ladderlectin-like [Solea solea]|uniref:ladderlectin-like n=1 Tax=Solea solea TaxID=90069 RepID=UPI002729A072|nr:ladderlectin-like [Solea solea]
MKSVILLMVAMVTLTRAEELKTDVIKEKPGNKTAPSAQQREILSPEEINVLSTGWTNLDRRRFLVVPFPMTWANAERNCQLLGGNLASIHSVTEYRRVQQLILTVTGLFPHTWLGGSDAQQEGTWFWSDGSLFRFNHWCPGQPDNYMSSHCLVMNFGDEKKFDDQLCLNERISVCSRD